jgi:hypothetical protein
MIHTDHRPHDEQTPARTSDPRAQALSPDMDFPDPPPETGGQEPVGAKDTPSPGV